MRFVTFQMVFWRLFRTLVFFIAAIVLNFIEIKIFDVPQFRSQVESSFQFLEMDVSANDYWRLVAHFLKFKKKIRNQILIMKLILWDCLHRFQIFLRTFHIFIISLKQSVDSFSVVRQIQHTRKLFFTNFLGWIIFVWKKVKNMLSAFKVSSEKHKKTLTWNELKGWC